nr:probable cytochrome P450 6a14 [Nomia melanderi]
MAIFYEILLGIVTVLLALYYYFTLHFDFWKVRNVPGPKPMPVFGNVLNVMTGVESVAIFTKNLCRQYKHEPMFGIIMRRTPVLILQDPDYIKDVLIKNFTSFEDRGFPMNEVAEPLSAHIFALEAKRWRPLRNQLTPVFTSGKLKEMFSLILECANHMEKYLDNLIQSGEPLDSRELMARYTTDVIGSCVFGIEMNSLSDKESKFRETGKEIFSASLWAIIKFRMKECVPALYDLLGYVLPYDAPTKFMRDVTIETMDYRMKDNIVRHDFINILIELRKHPEKLGDIKLTDTLLAAQAFVFFGAGFETSSTTMSHALYELALNHNIQEKLREEILRFNSDNNGSWTYEVTKKMIYLQKVIDETLRKYPVLAILTRDATADYTFANTKVSIPKGTKIWIPVYSIHRNPDIYPNPDKFDPERFDEDMKKTRHQMDYLPFGHGPRNCIGARFADYQMKLGLIKILLNHKVDVCEKTPEYRIHPFSFITMTAKPLYLKFSPTETMTGYLEILCAVGALLIAMYYYIVSRYNFWKKRNVNAPPPEFLFGNTRLVMFARKSIADLTMDVYKKYKNEPIVGLYSAMTPTLLIIDPEIIKDVMIRDFSKFADRGFNVHERTEPLSPNLFNLEAKRWRPLRSKLSPTFTAGKLKEMFSLMIDCGKQLEEYLDSVVEKEESVEIRELTAKFTTDVIGSCAFGIDMNAMDEKESEFRRKGREIFAASFENVLRLKIKLFSPTFYNLLGYVVPDRKLAPFFTKVVMDTVKYRKEHGIVRPDFIHMLMELQKHPEKLDNVEFTETLLTAQAFVFFAAGFETSSAAMSNALYELAQNHEVQDKLRAEIREHHRKCGGNFKYEDIKEMPYLDKVFKETLRKYPAGPIIMRKSTSDYTFESLKVTIPKSLVVWIPLFAIHRDPDIYPNPDKFDPERFSEEAIAARHPMHYLPFGDGPRNCIGARFAVTQTKVGLITILRNHKVDVCEKTEIPYEFDPGAFLLQPKGGIYLKLMKVK